MNDYALRYEYLLSRAFQCGRYGAPGADADVYRALERRFASFMDKTFTGNQNERLREYAYYCGTVATYIGTAIFKFDKDFKSQLTAAGHNQEIDEICMLLHDATIEKIEQAIDKAESLMLQYGLYPQ